jgi:hypothetical protein
LESEFHWGGTGLGIGISQLFSLGFTPLKSIWGKLIDC